MRLTHALLGCDLNPRYLESWELVRRAWLEVADVEPVLVLVAADVSKSSWTTGGHRSV
jgi:hypothetical protein